jgi:outer membrane lipoprotein SlyB
MAKARDRFDEMDPREKGLASALGGALAGGFAGRSLGKSRLTTLAGAAAGALGARQIATRSRYVAPILLTRFHV